jgi:CBS domain
VLQGCLEDLNVGDVMTSPVLSISPEKSIFHAMEILVERNISGLPVVGEIPAHHAVPTWSPSLWSLCWSFFLSKSYPFIHLVAAPDSDGEVIGVVSGTDLLALDCTPGRIDTSIGMFPPVDRYSDSSNPCVAPFCLQDCSPREHMATSAFVVEAEGRQTLLRAALVALP